MPSKNLVKGQIKINSSSFSLIEIERLLYCDFFSCGQRKKNFVQNLTRFFAFALPKQYEKLILKKLDI